jgi:16S rRNA (guanine966-N2)-methyltransferase
MRVITGLYKGRTIRTVNDLSVRPATDRVRQTLFNMLENRIQLEGSTVLDLFAGSGSLGIEALSRGAARVVFVESGREAARMLEENLATLGCEDSAEIVMTDALEFLRTERGQYNLVFADPPYIHEGTAEIPEMVFGQGLVSGGGYLLIEHSRELQFAPVPLYRVGPVKRFGRTSVTFFQGTPR